MEKLHIQLENENLRPQLDWIIDRASETNFDYPTVSSVMKKLNRIVLNKIFYFLTTGILDIYRSTLER